MLGFLVFGTLGFTLAAEMYFLYKLIEQEKKDNENNK